MDSSSPVNDSDVTRQYKREEKLRKKKQKIKQHGKDLGKIYRDSVEKRGETSKNIDIL
jgi:hypothetical protein